MRTYLFTFSLSLLLSMGLTPIVIWLARKMVSSADVPNVRKIHSKAIPRMGGVAIFTSMMTLMIPVLFLPNLIGESFRGILPELIVLFSAAGFMFFIGLIDDIKGLRARIKFFAQIAATLAVCAVGIRIKSVAVADWLTLDFGWFSWPLTLLWIVGITNAINLSDGLDGLAAGISAVACGVIAIFAVYSGQVVMAVLMLALLGSLTGFLFFNFSPAKIFMGDSGSMFLGFTIASSSVMCATKSSALVGLALPVLVLGIPIFDTLFSMLRRFLERRSMFASDRSHFHHRLLDLGIKQRHAVIVIYAVTLIAAGLGMFMMVTRNTNSLVIFLCILLLLLLIFRVVGSVRLRETIEGLRKKYAVSSQANKETMAFEVAQLHFRGAATFDQWWEAACIAAERLDFSKVKLPVTNRDGSHRILEWQSNKNNPTSDELLKVEVPVRDRRAGAPLNLNIEVCRDGSLESAGRRAALFTRLVDEKSIAALPIKNNND
jgi:UDP-GlcNAc:undecaprenyl-phosphate GlcNAc-1-phosphate transferase